MNPKFKANKQNTVCKMGVLRFDKFKKLPVGKRGKKI